MTQQRAKVPDIQPGLLRDARVYVSEEEAEAAQVVFSPHRRQGGGLLAEWHEVKLQYTAVSMLCMPLSMVGVAVSQLGPACDGMGFDPWRSSYQKAAQGTHPSNYR